MQRSARAFLSAFLVHRLRNREGVGIDFDHAVQGWAAPVDLLDAREIFFGKSARRELAGTQLVLQFGDANLVEFERFDWWTHS